jgi:hypothetical protein
MYAEFKPKVSVMIWRCITWHGSGTLGKVDGNNNAVKYTTSWHEYRSHVYLSRIRARWISHYMMSMSGDWTGHIIA